MDNSAPDDSAGWTRGAWISAGFICFGVLGLIGLRDETDILASMEPAHIVPFFAVPLAVGVVGLVIVIVIVIVIVRRGTR